MVLDRGIGLGLVILDLDLDAMDEMTVLVLGQNRMNSVNRPYFDDG